jgi:capsular polysaccharide transport system permease protein
MIDTPQQANFQGVIKRIIGLSKPHPYLTAVVIASLVMSGYWLLIASDRYVSEAHLVVQQTNLPGGQGMDFSGILSGVLGGSSNSDQLMLSDYLYSVDMLKKLDKKLNLKQHYSDSSRDLFSRLWFEEMEFFHQYYRKHTDIYQDAENGILYIKAQAYDPNTAQQIVSTLVQDGEVFINGLAHELANEQVKFLEEQVAKIKLQSIQTRQKLIAYQNKSGVLSPQANAESMIGILAQLEAKRIELDAQRNALRSYLVPNHPSIVQLDQQIAAINSQAKTERAKLAAPNGQTLNTTVEEFQRLEFDALFAQEVYKTGLAALERGRVEAARTIKKVAIVQQPTLPEYAQQPRRYYNAFMFVIVFLIVAGIAHLIMSIVKEHKD